MTEPEETPTRGYPAEEHADRLSTPPDTVWDGLAALAAPPETEEPTPQPESD